MKTPKNRAFAVAEVLVVVAITAILAAVSISSFVSFSRREALDASAEALAMGLRDARNQTLASVGGSRYGVVISSDSFTLFQGASYDPNALSNEIFEWNSYVGASSSLSTVVFERVTGNSSASGTIDVYLISDPSVKRSVSVSATGLVNIQ